MPFRAPDETLAEGLRRIHRVADDGMYPGRFSEELWPELTALLAALIDLLTLHIGTAGGLPSGVSPSRTVETVLTEDVRRGIDQLIEDLGSKLLQDPAAVSAAHYIEQLGALVETAFQQARAAEEVLAQSHPVDRVINEALQRFRSDTAHRQLMRELQAVAAARRDAEENAAAAERAVTATKQSAGEQGAWRLERHYGDYAEREARAANVFRGAAIFLLIFLVGAALRSPDESFTADRLVKRASVTIPLIALSGYLATEAVRHRRLAQWARTIQVQLRTFDAFVEPLEPEVAADVRSKFANRVFGDDPGAQAGNSAEAVDLVSRLTELLKVARQER